jgi:hypothetical protein
MSNKATRNQGSSLARKLALLFCAFACIAVGFAVWLISIQP